MQIYMSKTTNFFGRLERICEVKKLRGIAELAEKLGYSSAEKLNRLNRIGKANPSYNILVDLTNLFADVNVRWLLTGEGDVLSKERSAKMALVEETVEPYSKKKLDELQRLRIENETLLKALREVGLGRSFDPLDKSQKK